MSFPPALGTAEAPPVLGSVLGPRNTERLEPQERLRELGKGLSLERRRLRGNLLALHNSLTGGDSRGWGQAVLQGTGTGEGTASGWAREGQVGNWEKIFLKRVCYASGVPRALMKCPPLERCNIPVHVALGDMVRDGLGSAGDGLT